MPQTTLDPAALDPLGFGCFVAHGNQDYTVDVTARTCTCPAFRFRRGLCKHLRPGVLNATAARGRASRTLSDRLLADIRGVDTEPAGAEETTRPTNAGPRRSTAGLGEGSGDTPGPRTARPSRPPKPERSPSFILTCFSRPLMA